MKIDFNRKYNTIALYALLVIAAGVCIIMAVVKIRTVGNFVLRVLSILQPFIWGFAIAYILNPMMGAMERLLSKISKDKLDRRIRRRIAVLLSYVLSLAILVIFFRIVIPQIGLSLAALANQIPGWLQTLRDLAIELINKYNLESLPTTTVDKILAAAENLVSNLTAKLPTMVPQLLQATMNLTTGILNVLVGVIISVYLLLQKELFFAHIKKLLSAIFSQNTLNEILKVTHKSHAIFSGFINGKLLDSLIIGLLCLLFMTLFHWPYAMLISVIVGVTNIIPYFGPFFGTIPSILILLIADPLTALWFGIFILLLQQLDGNVIGPKILGDSTGLSPFWVIFAITLFGSLMGVLGMFIGVPLFAVIYYLITELTESRLKKRDLPPETAAYASEEHPLLPAKEKKPPKFSLKLKKPPFHHERKQ